MPRLIAAVPFADGRIGCASVAEAESQFRHSSLDGVLIRLLEPLLPCHAERLARSPQGRTRPQRRFQA